MSDEVRTRPWRIARVAGILVLLALIGGVLWRPVFALVAPSVATSAEFYRASRESLTQQVPLPSDPWGTSWIEDSRAPWGWRSAGPNRIDDRGGRDDILVSVPRFVHSVYDLGPPILVGVAFVVAYGATILALQAKSGRHPKRALVFAIVVSLPIALACTLVFESWQGLMVAPPMLTPQSLGSFLALWLAIGVGIALFRIHWSGTAEEVAAPPVFEQ